MRLLMTNPYICCLTDSIVPHLGLPYKVHDPPCVLDHDSPGSGGEGARQNERPPPSYQLQDTPSEILGGALGVNIREIEQQGRGSILAHRPIP